MMSTTAAVAVINVQFPMVQANATAEPVESTAVIQVIPVMESFAVRILPTELSPMIVPPPVISPAIPIITKILPVQVVKSIPLLIAAAVIQSVQLPPMVLPNVRLREHAAIIVTIPVTPHFAQAPV